MEVSAPLFAAGARYFSAGDDPLTERLTAELAMRCLIGESSPLYNRLYAEGLINQDFGAGADVMAGAANLILSGESRDPGAVLSAFAGEVRRVSETGLDPALFERARRASYGRRLRNLGSFLGSCAALAEGCFNGYEAMEGFEALERVTARDIQSFIRERLSPENLAISIVYPKTAEEDEA